MGGAGVGWEGGRCAEGYWVVSLNVRVLDLAGELRVGLTCVISNCMGVVRLQLKCGHRNAVDRGNEIQCLAAGVIKVHLADNAQTVVRPA